MMMIVLRLLSLLLPLLGLKSRWHRHFGRRPLNEVFFQGEKPGDSWTPGPKPLCHRHPTGPQPNGLLRTPAKGSSTKSNFALARGPRRSAARSNDSEDLVHPIVRIGGAAALDVDQCRLQLLGARARAAVADLELAFGRANRADRRHHCSSA